ncbi:hypothetical protein CANINC_000843 [Pichia inconspicua]|uniref:SPX domain-containing protein n=1 Tax=Pichia inconspicua TaxID=52247 RepID=A0A4V4NG37_9ASCO|nr:hypothetical protein CANINC_000843 [[Candida] inconspicua]
MKFGTEFNSRSVQRWKNYNIDYNLLKKLIKEATTSFDDSTSSSSSSSPLSSESDETANFRNSLNSHQKKLLKNLYKNFQDQIDFVSLFVFSKVGEISRRLSALKRQCNLFIESESLDLVSDVTLRIRKRKLMALHKELDSITTELKDLSRFLLLQKIAVKKLFKKFIKYSSYSKKQAFIDRINEKCLQQNTKSFVHLTLDDLTLETTLLYDFLDTYLNYNGKKDKPQNSNRNPSIHTIDSLTLTTESYNNKFSSQSEDENDKSHFPRTTTFDIVSKRKGPKSMIFWVHKDNLDELKFLLSSEFKLITDDSPFSKDTLLKKTRSTLNLNDNQENNISSQSTTTSHQINKLSKDDFTPETQTVSVWLNNPNCFHFVKSTDLSNINYTPKTIENLHYFKTNPYPQILVSNLKNSQSKNKEDINPILITPIGGLRQFSIATLDKSLVDELFDDSISYLDKDKKKIKLFNEWQERKLKGNSQMTQLSFNFIIDENLKPLASISSNKLRFINLDSTEKINSYLSLEWDIKIIKSDTNSTENATDIETFPYALLELNYELPESELPEKILNLIDSYLVYRVDHLNFSLNNYLIYSYINQFDSFTVSDDEMLLFIAPWYEVLNKDIRSLPEIRSKTSYTNDSDIPMLTPQEGILLNKNDEICKKPGYWNEFDNGSDYGDDSEGFYVYENNENRENSFTKWFTSLFLGKVNTRANDIESNSSTFSNNSGLEWISPENTAKLLKLSEKMSKMGDKLKKTIFQLNDSENGFNENLSLLRRNNVINFGSINDETGYADTENDESDSDTEAILSTLPQHGRGSISRSDLYITKENHDKCLSFLYLTMIVCSALTSSIGAIIIKIIFASNTLFQPQLTAGIIVLMTFAIFCLTLSLILTGFSISLLIFRFTKAPIWHFLVVWSFALISTTFFFYGLTTCI